MKDQTLNLPPELTCSGLSVRLGQEPDVAPVTNVIHRAFEVWKGSGLKLSPMFQSDESTRSHLVNQGYVIEDQDKHIIGTFSLSIGHLNVTSAGVEYSERASPHLLFQGTSNKIRLNGAYLVFKKAAVLPDHRKKGLGKAMIQLSETIARTNNLRGLVLETVESATRLYQWYIELGFVTIGRYRYPNSEVETVLMIRSLRPL